MNATPDIPQVGTWRDEIWFIAFLLLQFWRTVDNVALGLPLAFLGLVVFIAKPLSIYHLLAATVLVVGARYWIFYVNQKHDLKVLRDYYEGWYSKFQDARFTLLQLDPPLFSAASKVHETEGGMPLVLVTEPKAGGKWPSAWMTYQFRAHRPIICVDVHPSKMTASQRFLLNHEIGHCQFSHHLFDTLISDQRYLLPSLVACLAFLLPFHVSAALRFAAATSLLALVLIRQGRRVSRNRDPSEEFSDDFAVAALMAETRGDKGQYGKVVNAYIKTIPEASGREAFLDKVEWYAGTYAIHGHSKFFRLFSQINWTTTKHLGVISSLLVWSCLVYLGLKAEIPSAWRIVGLVLICLIIPLSTASFLRFKALAGQCNLTIGRDGAFILSPIEDHKPA